MGLESPTINTPLGEGVIKSTLHSNHFRYNSAGFPRYLHAPLTGYHLYKQWSISAMGTMVTGNLYMLCTTACGRYWNGKLLTLIFFQNYPLQESGYKHPNSYLSSSTPAKESEADSFNLHVVISYIGQSHITKYMQGSKKLLYQGNS